MKLRNRESSEQFSVFLEMSELAYRLGYKVRCHEIWRSQVKPSGLWFHVSTPGGGVARIGYREKRKSHFAPCMSELRSFLEQFYRAEEETLCIQYFGEWAPSESHTVYEVTLEQDTDFFVQFYLTIFQPSQEAQHRVIKRVWEDKKSTFQVDLKFATCVAEFSEKNPIPFKGEFLGRLTEHSRWDYECFQLVYREGRYIMKGEEHTRTSESSTELPATLQIHGLSMGFTDYLAFQPGDEIELGDLSGVAVTLSLGGVVLADGVIEFEDGTFIFQPHHNSLAESLPKEETFLDISR